jgi:hypothetical protein
MESIQECFSVDNPEIIQYSSLMKFTYPDGVVEKSDKFPYNFTGTVEWEKGSKGYCVNGFYNREGGLPALEWANGNKEYIVNGKWTGQFLP